MAVIKAFKPYRPVRDRVTQIAALPYDVMDTEEAKMLVKDNPYSFLHVDKPDMHVIDPKGDELYQYAGNKLDAMIKEGVFEKENNPSLYIYGIHNQFTSQYGIVGCVSCEEYDEGHIKKHENTRADKEQDRIKHVAYCKAHTGPIFLAYNGLESLTGWMLEYVNEHTALYDFVAEDGVRHEVYRIEQKEEISFVQEAFKEAETLYIADGHHRAAAACAYARMQKQSNTHHTGQEEYNYFLATIFPKKQLYIMDYNRVLKDESGLGEEALFNELKKLFNIRCIEDTTYTPNARHTFGMRYQGHWYQLTLKQGIVDEQDPVASLDVTVLQDYVLHPIFKIEDPRKDKRIDFIGGIRGIKELNRRTDAEMDIAFSMYPTSIDELIMVADANELMPPKSTWFEPKLRSGLFIHKIVK